MIFVHVVTIAMFVIVNSDLVAKGNYNVEESVERAGRVADSAVQFGNFLLGAPRKRNKKCSFSPYTIDLEYWFV